MKAFLMAAGKGTRAQVFTDNPKSLLKIGNKSIIRHTVEMLKNRNIDVVIVIGYKGNLIQEELKDINNIEYIYNLEYDNSNSIYSLYKAIDKLNEECIIANADVYWDEDMLNYVISNEYYANAIMLGDDSKDRLDNGDFFFYSNNDNIVEYGKELVRSKRTYEYVGIAKIKSNFIQDFKNKIVELVKNNRLELWWENALYELSPKFDIKIGNIQGMIWGEVDTESDYKKLLKMKGELLYEE